MTPKLNLKTISIICSTIPSVRKVLETIRNCIKVEFFQKDDNCKISKQQSKINFNETQKPYTFFDNYTL